MGVASAGAVQQAKRDGVAVAIDTAELQGRALGHRGNGQGGAASGLEGEF